MMMRPDDSKRAKYAQKNVRSILVAILSCCVGFFSARLTGQPYYEVEKQVHRLEFMENASAGTATCPTVKFDGCPDFAQNRPVGCYNRTPPPPPNPCRTCSSQIHLSPGADASTSITVSLAIDYACGSSGVNVTVHVGKDPKNLEHIYISQEKDVTQYTSTSCMADDPKVCQETRINHEKRHWCNAEHFGTYQSDWFHHVSVEGLEPHTRYYYTVDPSPCNEALDVFSFTTSPAIKVNNTGPERYGTKIAITGDPGQSKDTDITFQGIFEDKDVDFLIITGDISYANRNHRMHDVWFHKYEYVLANLPLMVTPGNHDVETDCCDWSVFKAYENRFRMPQVKPPVLGYACVQPDSAPPDYNFDGKYDFGNAFYSVTVGPSRFLFLNTYTNSAVDSPQFQWLESQLERVNRTETPWLFIVAHGTIYETFSKHLHETGQATMKKAMEPLFHKYGVNAFFCGHDHLYARTHAVVNGAVEPNGHAPMYITIGNGGHSSHQKDQLPHDEEWVATWDWWTYGFGTLTVLNDTHAHWETKFHNNSKKGFVPGTDSVYLVNYVVIANEQTDARQES